MMGASHYVSITSQSKTVERSEESAHDPTPELQPALDRAYTTMCEHLSHSLPKSARCAIYHALTRAAGDTAVHVHRCLDWLNARYALPIWQRTWPDDRLLSLILDLVRGVVSGNVDPIAIQSEVGDASAIMSERIDSYEGVAHLDALFAGLADLQTLQHVTSGYRYTPYTTLVYADQVSPTWQEQWQEGDWDVAAWGVAAYAGGLVPLGIQSAKQHTFWHWWLTTAIPRALHLPDVIACAPLLPSLSSIWVSRFCARSMTGTGGQVTIMCHCSHPSLPHSQRVNR